MSKNRSLIDFTYINETLYGDKDFIKEFCSAAILSFSEFKENYQKHLFNRNEPELRKAGHKIKPVAQMLKLDAVLDEYENAKILLAEESPDDQLKTSVSKMNNTCSEILKELEETIERI